MLALDVSTGVARPYVPNDFRYLVFQALHTLAILVFIPLNILSIPLMSGQVWMQIYWKGPHHVFKAKKQKFRTYSHSTSNLQVATPDVGFDYIHIDIVRLLPPSHGYSYILTCIDRFTRWTEANLLKQFAKHLYVHVDGSHNLVSIYCYCRSWTSIPIITLETPHDTVIGSSRLRIPLPTTQLPTASLNDFIDSSKPHSRYIISPTVRLTHYQSYCSASELPSNKTLLVPMQKWFMAFNSEHSSTLCQIL
jgi:hypothetical protein